MLSIYQLMLYAGIAGVAANALRMREPVAVAPQVRIPKPTVRRVFTRGQGY